MKHRLYFLILLCTLVLFPGCSRNDARQPGQEAEARPPENISISLTASESAYLENLRRNGGLKVATLLYPGAYERDASGRERGFHYRMIQALGDMLDMPVSVRFVNFDDAFTENGVIPPEVKTDPEVEYTPDLLKQVDIFAFDLTEVPWRSKLMTIIPLVPTRVLVVNRRGEEVAYLGQFQNKRFTIYRNTSHEIFLENIEKRLGIPIEIIPVEFGEDRSQLLQSDEADFIITDSQTSVIEISRNNDLNISFALTDIEMNGWAVSKINTTLASILRKFFDQARSSGILDEAWQEGYGVSLDRYYNLIGYPQSTVLTFDDEEKGYIESLEKRGGMRIAIGDVTSVYEENENGTIGGLHYYLALEIAHVLGVPVRFRPVSFYEFFEKDGEVPELVKTDPGYYYTPDLLGEADLFISTFSPLPWRKKFLDFIELYPTKKVFVTRKDFRKVTLADLKDLKISILTDTSYEAFLRKHYDLSDVSVIFTQTAEDAVRMVSAGRTDITIEDASTLITRLKKYRNLTFYPADDTVEMLSWALARDNQLLERVLIKTIAYLRSTGRFDVIWKDYYGITFNEYLDLISYRGSE